MIDLERDPAIGAESVSNDYKSWSDDTELLREMVELSTVPMVQPGDITVTAFAEVAGRIPRNTARNRLDVLVRRGVLVTPPGLCLHPETHKYVRVWRKKNV